MSDPHVPGPPPPPTPDVDPAVGGPPPPDALRTPGVHAADADEGRVAASGVAGALRRWGGRVRARTEGWAIDTADRIEERGDMLAQTRAEVTGAEDPVGGARIRPPTRGDERRVAGHRADVFNRRYREQRLAARETRLNKIFHTEAAGPRSTVNQRSRTLRFRRMDAVRDLRQRMRDGTVEWVDGVEEIAAINGRLDDLVHEGETVRGVMAPSQRRTDRQGQRNRNALERHINRVGLTPIERMQLRFLNWATGREQYEEPEPIEVPEPEPNNAPYPRSAEAIDRSRSLEANPNRDPVALAAAQLESMLLLDTDPTPENMTRAWEDSGVLVDRLEHDARAHLAVISRDKLRIEAIERRRTVAPLTNQDQARLDECNRNIAAAQAELGDLREDQNQALWDQAALELTFTPPDPHSSARHASRRELPHGEVGIMWRNAKVNGIVDNWVILSDGSSMRRARRTVFTPAVDGTGKPMIDPGTRRQIMTASIEEADEYYNPRGELTDRRVI